MFQVYCISLADTLVAMVMTGWRAVLGPLDKTIWEMVSTVGLILFTQKQTIGSVHFIPPPSRSRTK